MENEPINLVRRRTRMYQYWIPIWGDRRVFSTGEGPVVMSELQEYFTLMDAVFIKKLLALDWEQLYIQDTDVFRLGNHSRFSSDEKYRYAEEKVSRLDCVIVGRTNFNQDFLRFLLPRASKNKNIVVISQEDFFLSLAQFSEPTPYHSAHLKVIRQHEGLQFLASIGFEWPKQYWPGSSSGRRDNDWAEQSELKRRFGYNVASETTIDERHDSLRRAVGEMGLKDVASYIVNHLIRVHRNDDRMSGALERWNEDVLWLKRVYYDRSIYRFSWPPE